MTSKAKHQRQTLRAEGRASQLSRESRKRKTKGKAGRGRRKPRRPSVWRRLVTWTLLAVLAGAVLSLGIEIVQLFIQSRNSAPHDLLNNALGSWMGAVAGSIYAVQLASVSRRIFYDLLDRKPFLLLVTIFGLA